MDKRRSVIKTTLGAIFALCMLAASAQNPMNLNRQRDVLGTQSSQGMNPMQYGNVPGVQDNNEELEPQDTTTKPPKLRKPLESYFFGDSLRGKPNFVWSVNMSGNDINMRQVDTALYEFQNDYPYLRNGVGSAYLGNLGAAEVPLNYFRRPQYRNFEFAQSYASYILTPETARFFNVKKPFTHLSYFMSGQTKRLEEDFWATHAQNISPTTGFNVDYKSMGTRGMYINQKTRDKSLSVGFSHTGKKYTIHAGYIYNMANVRENGGVLRDQDITDTVFEMPEIVDVRLTDARNEYKNNTYYLIQSYGIPLTKLTDEDFTIADKSTVFFGHSFEYSRFRKKYTDTKQASGDYYKDWFINPVSSNDSIFESLLSNKVFVQLQPWDRNAVIGVVNAGIGNDIHHYYQFTLDDFFKVNKGVNKVSTYVYGSVEGKIKKYVDWNANIKYHPFGYRSQDLTLGAELALSAYIKGHPITLTGSLLYDSRSPGYWTENYFSNHFAWNNSFAKENETRLSVVFRVPFAGLEIGAEQSVIKDKIYVDANRLPAQYSGTVSVSGVYASKDFRLGGFHLNHRAMFQHSSAPEVIPVPMVSAYLSYYYEFNIVRNVLRLQLGVDGRYNTKYYAFGYTPSTMQFYNQREKKIGGYPLLDVFAAAKWKRMRILAKLQHFNEDLLGDRNYFSVLHYPMNKRMFKLGFSWTFYD